jgi:hypothetical protein
MRGADVDVPHDVGLLKCGSKKVLESPVETVSNEQTKMERQDN